MYKRVRVSDVTVWSVGSYTNDLPQWKFEILPKLSSDFSRFEHFPRLNLSINIKIDHLIVFKFKNKIIENLQGPKKKNRYAKIESKSAEIWCDDIKKTKKYCEWGRGVSELLSMARAHAHVHKHTYTYIHTRVHARTCLHLPHRQP